MSISSSSSPPPQKVRSNLESFLHYVTPVVATKPLSLVEQGDDNESRYFILGDLWKCYEEWSAYGAYTPLVLNTGETVVQYYAPFLSAIQLYPIRNNNIIDSNVDQDGLSQQKEFDPIAYDYFEFSETVSPYWRVPLMDKIFELAETSPRLTTLKSTDLSPASWMSVAWCPIYHIPCKGKVEDLATHFLTFHTLSSCFQDTQANGNICSSDEDVYFQKRDKNITISLPPFGLCSLGMQGEIWMNQIADDYDKLINLHSAADSWLKQVGFHHHDFHYYHKKNLEMGSIFK